MGLGSVFGTPLLNVGRLIFPLVAFYRKIQEEGLRTYLFTYAPYYDSLSLSLLATTFALPIRSVISIVSKMIWTDELPASLDQIDGVVVFHRVEQSRVQQLAQELATKAEYFVEQNEKTLDIKLGSGPGGREDGGRGDKGAGEGGRGRGERRGRGETGLIVAVGSTFH